MPVYDFECPDGHIYEVRCSIAEREQAFACTHAVYTVGAVTGDEPGNEPCGQIGKRLISTPAMPTTIVLDYPGSKRLKAGYVHSHGPRKASKIQSGYGGMVSPERKHLHPIANNVIPQAARFRKPSTD